MKNSLKILSLAFVVSFALVFTSCEKENIDKVIEEAGEVPTNNIISTGTGNAIGTSKASSNTAAISYQGTTTVINAYASYCSKNNKEFLTVTNNQALLSNTSFWSISTNNLNDGDFIIAYMIDTLGATPVDFVMWSKVDTTAGNTFIDLLVDAPNTLNFSVDPVLNTVKGSMSGSFMTGLIGGGVPNPSPYTINFDANILQPHTFCD